jgi:hypothetical protein
MVLAVISNAQALKPLLAQVLGADDPKYLKCNPH